MQNNDQPLTQLNWAQLPTDYLVDNKYRVLRPLLSGAGGSVYLVKEEITPSLQLIKCKKMKSQSSQLTLEDHH